MLDGGEGKMDWWVSARAGSASWSQRPAACAYALCTEAGRSRQWLAGSHSASRAGEGRGFLEVRSICFALEVSQGELIFASWKPGFITLAFFLSRALCGGVSGLPSIGWRRAGKSYRRSANAEMAWFAREISQGASIFLNIFI